MTRPRKQRALRKAGLVSVSGWVRAEDAEAVQKMIEAAQEAYDRALSEMKPDAAGGE